MKYLLVILGFFLAFNPNGLCGNDRCCSDAIELSAHGQDTDDHHSCSDHAEDTVKSNCQSSDHSENTVHSCDFCVISMLLPSFTDLEVSEKIFKPTLSDFSNKLASRFYFSIWNPPNL